MNDNLTISTFQLFKLFPDSESARLYLESRLWPHGAKCPICASGERITARKDGYYRCNACREDFTVRTGTIFERSHVPLHKWLYAMYLLVTARKGISSIQLSKEIGITQKSAWFVLHRLREACGDDLAQLQGIVEIDETYFGGKEANKHQRKKLNAGRGAVGKAAVLGMRERGGKTGLFFRHEAINHSGGEYVRGNVTTNSIESVFAVMKRGVLGVYHHTSRKHLGRYVNEFTFRLNDGNCKRHTLDRLDSFVSAVVGKRLTYKALTQ